MQHMQQPQDTELLSHGQQTWTTSMDMSRFVQILVSELCRSLPSLYAFTGCDSFSAFFGKEQGKRFEAC